MSSSISYSKYPDSGQNTYNGGNFFSNDKVATAGCSGTTCNVLAANSVFEPEKGAPLASNQSGGKSKKRRSRKRRYSKKIRSRRRRHSRKMKGGSKGLYLEKNQSYGNTYPTGGASKRRSRKRRHSRKMKGGMFNPILNSLRKGGSSKKRRSHRRRHSRKMKGGMAMNAISRNYQNGGGTQLMNNICHSSGYSIGPVGTELKPTEVGLAALHYAPYTKTQNN